MPTAVLARALAGFRRGSGAPGWSVACDQPRGATFAAARPCAAPGTTDSTPGGLARRLAYH